MWMYQTNRQIWTKTGESQGFFYWSTDGFYDSIKRVIFQLKGENLFSVVLASGTAYYNLNVWTQHSCNCFLLFLNSLYTHKIETQQVLVELPIFNTGKFQSQGLGLRLVKLIWITGIKVSNS